MKTCEHSKTNIKCNCSYPGCPRKGICCECLHYHREKNQLPACFFNRQAEKTYDRSIDNFISQYR